MSKIAVLNEFSIEAIKDAIQKLDAFDNLKVNGLYAGQLNELEAIDPVLYARVAENIKADKWIPFAGAWTKSDELSEIGLIKSCLYSARYFLDRFGKKYRVFHGVKLYNDLFPQIVYSSLFDAAVLDSENESKWLHGADGFRTLVMHTDTDDVTDMDDDFIKENEFISYEELADSIFESHLELETVFLPSKTVKAEGIEKQLVDAEKYTAVNGEDKTAEIKEAWISHFNGDDESAKKIAENITGSTAPDESGFKLSGSIELAEIKLAEDGSGDTILRVAQTDGKENSSYIMCDRLNAAFRFEIMPYEIQTFRIGADGRVQEIYICE